MSNLTANNTSLQEILAAVNALPEEEGGSGGGVETCTVYATGCRYVFYTGVENGQPVAKESVGNDKYAAHSVIACKNSMVVCADLQSSKYVFPSGADLVRGNNTYYVAVKIDQGAEEATILTTGQGGGGTND